MKHCPSFLTQLFLFLSVMFFVPTVLAATPDGAGPWADSVVSFTQGTMKNGLAVPLVRSNASAALGVAEDNTADGSFVSLGFGGSLILGFDNPVSDGVIVVEATNPEYPKEKAQIEVSSDGNTWVVAGTIEQDGQVSMPQTVSCAKYVRITDKSVKEDFSDETADGFDVDGIKTSGSSSCSGGGKTDITITQTSVCVIDQTQKTQVLSGITTKSITGKNSVKKSTGKVLIKTGTSQTNTAVSVIGGTNYASGCGCCTCPNNTGVVN